MLWSGGRRRGRRRRRRLGWRRRRRRGARLAALRRVRRWLGLLWGPDGLVVLRPWGACSCGLVGGGIALVFCPRPRPRSGRSRCQVQVCLGCHGIGSWENRWLWFNILGCIFEMLHCDLLRLEDRTRNSQADDHQQACRVVWALPVSVGQLSV